MIELASADVRASRSMPGGSERALTFHTLRPADYRAIVAQPSQAGLALGMPGPDDAELEHYCAQPVAWAVRQAHGERGSRLLACFGIVELIPGKRGLAWAMLAAGIGAAHLALTRFIQGQVAAASLPRLELLAAAPDLEAALALLDRPGGRKLDSGQIVAMALRQATPEMRWAMLLGFTPAHLLRRFGANGESVMMFEKFGGAG